MKAKQNGQKFITAGLGAVLIIGVSSLTVFSASTLINKLNADADMQYVSALNERSYNTSQAPPDNEVNDNNQETLDESKFDSSPVVQSSDDDFSIGEETQSTDDTDVSVDDNEVVTYPYYIGTDFVVVDPDGNMIYTVQKGDTLSDISKIVGYSVDELADYNHIANKNLIYVNESIRIPASEDLVESVKAYIEDTGTDTEVSVDGPLCGTE